MKTVHGSTYKSPGIGDWGKAGAVRVGWRRAFKRALKLSDQKLLECFWVQFFIKDNITKKEDVFLSYKQTSAIQNSIWTKYIEQ